MKKKLSTLWRLIKRFRQDIKEFSIGVATGRFVRDIPFISWEKRRGYYEKQIYNYLKSEYESVIQYCVEKYNEKDAKTCEKTYIWVMWWQGENAMPPIVKACYSSIKRAAKDYELVLITEENWKQYVEIPQYIIDKVDCKKITLTHFSDIVRAALLKRWGGLWVDATVYVEQFPVMLFQNEFYTLKAPGMFAEFVSGGEWSPFLLGFSKTNSLCMVCLNRLFEEYWKKHEKIIDYLLIDYSIKLLKDSIPEIREQLDLLPQNREYYALNLNINYPYNEIDWKCMLQKSPLQKLTYKKEFKLCDDEGCTTYYSHLLREEEIIYE